LTEGIALIEWPERLGPLLPSRRIEVRIAFSGAAEERRIDIAAPPEAAERLAAAFPP
jgi:tRNA threonylcarbamoyladenosine biosynthesis protein TsaE